MSRDVTAVPSEGRKRIADWNALPPPNVLECDDPGHRSMSVKELAKVASTKRKVNVRP